VIDGSSIVTNAVVSQQHIAKGAEVVFTAPFVSALVQLQISKSSTRIVVIEMPHAKEKLSGRDGARRFFN